MLLAGEVTATAWLPTCDVISARQWSYPASALSGVHLPGKTTACCVVLDIQQWTRLYFEVRVRCMYVCMYVCMYIVVAGFLNPFPDTPVSLLVPLCVCLFDHPRVRLYSCIRLCVRAALLVAGCAAPRHCTCAAASCSTCLRRRERQ